MNGKMLSKCFEQDLLKPLWTIKVFEKDDVPELSKSFDQDVEQDLIKFLRRCCQSFTKALIKSWSTFDEPVERWDTSWRGLGLGDWEGGWEFSESETRMSWREIWNGGCWRGGILAQSIPFYTTSTTTNNNSILLKLTQIAYSHM